MLVAPTSAPRAESVVLKAADFREERGQLVVSAGFRELFDHALRKQLRSGFATTVVMRVYLYARDGGAAVAVSGQTLRAVYDLWDEVYLLRVEDARGNYYVRLRDQRQVVDRLTSFWRFPVGALARLRRGEGYFVAGVVEVNPMSPEVLAEVRRWLRNPSRQPRQVGGESFFGSFVSIFVNNKIRRAERTFKFRSQLHWRPR
ncbi:MAG: hypothetical protein IT371_15125 [Deltaproteobacteria bacterium]|nr:hypothetical protein [Deltaproteobacteria bacterium]